MKNLYIYLLMLFMHIVDDFYLQGWLASAKQKEWWEKNAPEKVYRFDYIWALMIHSFSWTFMVMMPIAFIMNFEVNGVFICLFVGNLLIHAIVDNMKANLKMINLITDQSIHMLQILITCVIMIG